MRSAFSLVAIALLVSGCASLDPRRAGDEARESSPPARRAATAPPDLRAEAYFQYSVAQLHAQAGRFREAIPAVQEAIKRDPGSAFLWMQLAQWLARADQPDEALTAARRAVSLAPDDGASHVALAELLRAQKKYAEAEAELEKVITINPDAEEPYLTLARYQVENAVGGSAGDQQLLVLRRVR